MRLLIPALAGAVFGLAPLTLLAEEDYSADDRDAARTMLSDMEQAVERNYYPPERAGKEFAARCAEAGQAIDRAGSNAEAFAAIADALASLDPRIRFLPPIRQVRIDYGWKWRMIGDAGFVTEVDREGDARRQGLQLGDRVLSVEGTPIDRTSWQAIHYTFNTLAPRPGLRVQVQTPGQEPRLLALAATVRPQRRLLTSGSRTSFWTTWQLSETDARHRDEFYDLTQHLHLSGTTVVWRAIELDRDIDSVADGLKRLRGAAALVLDLRGQWVGRHETVMRLLDGLFRQGFDAGVIKREETFHTTLRVHGDSAAFTGVVLVLVDAETRGYAEILARIIQLRQRGVIIGDRTMGRAFQEVQVHHARGATFAFSAAGVVVPAGEILLADGASVDGTGVIPDLLLLPQPADLAGKRDVVLARAFALLKQRIAPEEAYNLVHLASEDDDDNDN